jgi:4'-phosphopantetheinyl transferase
MSSSAEIRVWTMRVDGLDEPAVAAWRAMLDAGERQRAARFIQARNRIEFIAAHALMRAALAQLVRRPAMAWRFVAGAHGKPAAWLDGEPAPLSFNLSHTAGIVGLAAVASPGLDIGFDLESLARIVDLRVADRYFTPQEIGWLAASPEAERPCGFLRLWTLKEAFIKATGKGLTQDLAAFWFTPSPPRIHFADIPGERETDWHFEQRLLDGGFVGALGMRGAPRATRWTAVDPAELGPEGLRRRT